MFKRLSGGFTMIELLIAIALLAVFTTITMVTLNQTQRRGNDVRRKQDLEEMHTAFEEYYNDNSCYPPAEALDDCNGSTLAPYLRTIKCDPITKQPYAYVPQANRCEGYRIYTHLDVGDDEDINKVGCDGANGCGYPSNPEYNYGVSSGTTVRYTE